MIVNIIDRRKHQRRWKRINAIVEPTWHDNSRPDSDQAERGRDDFAYDQREDISFADAIAWANSLPDRVTLYLYDQGKGTTLLENWVELLRGKRINASCQSRTQHGRGRFGAQQAWKLS